MEFSVPLPQQLDKNGVLLKQWTSFSQRFHCFRNSCSSTNEPWLETSSILLFSAHSHMDSVCDALKLYGLDSFKLSRILEIVENVCLPSFLLLFERFRYFTLEQHSTETLHDFVNSMRKQVELCEFGDTKDSIMTTTLVNGVNDEGFRQSLQNTSSLHFDDAVNICSGLSNRSSNSGNVAPPVEVKIVPKLKIKAASLSQSISDSSMYIVPLHYSSNEDVESEDHFVKTVLNERRKKHKKKSKKKRSSGHKSFKSKVFLCFSCNNEYASRKSFRRHIASKHSDCSEYFCKHCDKTFHSRSDCITHCMGHKSSPSSGLPLVEGKGVDCTEHICWYCQETISSLIEYKKHCATHSAVRVFYCDLCQRKNHTLPRMIGHLKGHLSPRYRCEICANCFGRAELLDAHMQTHAAQPIHQCQVCGKNFVSADRLQGHMRTHSGEKRFTCELCGKSFCQKMSLDYHKRVHSGEKPYECEVCGKRTASFGYLRKHKQMHSEKRPYVCEVCGKSFRFASNLNRHCNGHTGRRAFGCDICGRTFIYGEGLRDHIKAGRCPGRKHEEVIKRQRAPRSKSQHSPRSSASSMQNLAPYVPSHHPPTDALLTELPHWQYMLRNNEPDGTNGVVLVPPYY